MSRFLGIRCSASMALFLTLIPFVSLISAVYSTSMHDSENNLQLDPSKIEVDDERKLLSISVGNMPKERQTLVIYELYHSNRTWKSLHPKGSRIFRAVSNSPHSTRPNSSDIIAPDVLPVLHDTTYQLLLSEYSGILAVAKLAELGFAEAEWIGFQSWKAKIKRKAISDDTLAALEPYLKENATINSFIFWALPNPHGPFPDYLQSCLSFHGKYCLILFSAPFKFMTKGDLRNRSKRGKIRFEKHFYPPMPLDPQAWSYASFFILHRTALVEYAAFIRMYFVTMEYLWDFHTKRKCPIRGGSRCWAYVLELLVNVWVYHTGKRIIFVDPSWKLKGIQEHLDIKSRMHTDWLNNSTLANLEKQFKTRLSLEMLRLYEGLGG